MTYKSSFLTQLFSYTGFQAINKAVPFLILPILTRYFTKEEVGFYTLYQALILIVFPLLTISLQTAVAVNYFRLKKIRFIRYFSNVVFVTFFTCLSGILLCLLIGPFIADRINFPFIWLLITILTIFPQFLLQLRLTLSRNQGRIVHFGVYAIVNTLLTNGLGLLLVFFSPLSWKGIVLGIFIGGIIISVFCIVSFYKEHLIVYKKSIGFIKDAIKIGLPASFHQIGSWFSNTFNRVIINILLGTAATGSYGVGSIYGMIITFIQDSFNLAYTPYLFNMLKNNDSSTQFKLVKMSFIFYISIFVIAFFIFLCGMFFTGTIFGDNYVDTKQFILPLILASVVNGFYKIHVNYLFYYKKTLSIAKITFALGLLNIPLAYIFVKYWGLLGAAYSVLFIQFFSYLFILIKANQVYPMNWLKNMNYILFNK